MKEIAILLASLLFCGCLNIDLQTIEADYLMSIELFPDDHKIEGTLKVENLSGKEITGSIHPDLVIDSIKDENGNEIEYERDIELIEVGENYSMRQGSITAYPEDSKVLDIHFHGKPYDDILEKHYIGKSTFWDTGSILRLDIQECNSVFSITVPKDFKVLKLSEQKMIIKTKVENGSRFAYGFPRYIAGAEPAVKLHDGKATYTVKTNNISGFSFVCSDYVSFIEVKDGIEYRVYLFPEHENMLESTMNLAQEAIEFYSEKFYPYPLKEFRVVEAEMGGTYDANDKYSTSLIMPDCGDFWCEYMKELGVEMEMEECIKEYFNNTEGTVHETSHFWFGGLVYSTKLSESFATFSEFLFTENFDPDLSRKLRKYYTDVLIETSDWQNVSFADAEWDLRTFYISYFKGGMIIYMLYDLLGEELFEVLHDYFEIYGGQPGAPGVASLEDFIDLVNQKKDLKWFFDEWVYRPGLPVYELSNPYITRENGGYRIDFDIVQKDGIYEMFVEISAGENIESFWVDQKVERVTIYVDSLPEKLILDPDWKIPRYGGEVYLDL